MTKQPLDLLTTFQLVREVLAETGLRHAFIGALPVLAWGRIRTTTDLDLVIVADPAALARLESSLLARGVQRGKATGPAESAETIPDIAAYWHSTSPDAPPVRIDVFLAKTPFEETVLAGARPAEVLGASVAVARPESSIIYKLLAHRGRDVDDVESIFENRAAAGESLDWTYLDEWAEAWGISERLAPYSAKYRVP